MSRTRFVQWGYVATATRTAGRRRETAPTRPVTPAGWPTVSYGLLSSYCRLSARRDSKQYQSPVIADSVSGDDR